MWRRYLRGISSVSRPASWLKRNLFAPSAPPAACYVAAQSFFLPIIFFLSRPTAQVRSSTTMKLFFPLFAAAIAAPVSAEFYLKEQFNDDVSFAVM